MRRVASCGSAISRILGDAGWTSHDDREPWLESAPVHVLVCTRENDYHDRYRMPDKLDGGGDEIDSVRWERW